MSTPAVAGGAPVRQDRLPYGRHDLREEDIEAVVTSLRSGQLTGGRAVADLERSLVSHCGGAEAVAVVNGTAALHVALMALGVGTGDEVITTPLTFVATANAILYTGAVPVFADIGEDRCLDPESVASHVTTRTRAVVAVDYGGLPADIPAIRGALPWPLPVVVDAAHSLGATFAAQEVAARGDATVLSFHPVKQVTTGEGGACLTADPTLAERMRRLRNHGMTRSAAERAGAQWQYDVDQLGHNYRLTDFQAALGVAQLGRLDEVLQRRAFLARRYDSLLDGIPGVGLPPQPATRECAWHLYAIDIDAGAFGCTRDDVIDALRAENIEATLHYPAVHLLSLYRDLGCTPGLAPRAERTCSRLVTLPLFPTMMEADQDDVITALRRIQAWCHRLAAV